MKTTIKLLPIFVLMTAPLLSVLAQTAPMLIPFQGRLTEQNGVAYTNGQYTMMFQLYDQPVGGTLLWSERHEKVGVMNGMVNVFLGSIRALDQPFGTNPPVSFSTTRYLGITVDVDNNPATADPEMIPRQMIIPAFYARRAADSEKLAGYDWTPLFGVNNPSGTFNGAKIAAGTIPGTALANRAVTGINIDTNTIDLSKLVAPQTGSNVGVGGIAISPSTLDWVSPTPSTPVPVTNLDVTIVTRGGPVEVYLTASPNPNLPEHPSYIFAQRASDSADGAKSAAVIVQLWSDQGLLLEEQTHDVNKREVINSDVNLTVSPSVFRFIDTPPAGTRRYFIKAKSGAGNVGDSPREVLQFYYVRLVAKEL